MAKAREGFGFWFDTYGIAAAVASRRHTVPLLRRMYDFVNAPACLDFIRTITGVEGIRSADMEATRYRPGSFLTKHDDEESDRLVAYVFNFTPGWVADYGGVLSFLAPEGHIVGAYTPAFNALNLFTVPRLHAVSVVAPFAKGARYALTGWFRAGVPSRG